jgi:hypothetical protein
VTTLARHYWPEPTGVHGQPDRATVVLTGTLAYPRLRVSRQALPYATGVFRLPNGEMPIEILAGIYPTVRQHITAGTVRTLTGRIDRRGRIHVLTVTGCTPPLSTENTPA